MVELPNILGVMELDASFMDGNNRSVGARRGRPEISSHQIARRLMDTPLHTLVVGALAPERFAFDCGLEIRTDPSPSAI